MTYLTANLASKGYIVAAIDHTDSVFDALKGFESTLLNRSSQEPGYLRSLHRTASSYSVSFQRLRVFWPYGYKVLSILGLAEDFSFADFQRQALNR